RRAGAPAATPGPLRRRAGVTAPPRRLAAGPPRRHFLAPERSGDYPLPCSLMDDEVLPPRCGRSPALPPDPLRVWSDRRQAREPGLPPMWAHAAAEPPAYHCRRRRDRQPWPRLRRDRWYNAPGG